MSRTTVINAFFFFLLVFALIFSLSVTKGDVIEEIKKKVADSQIKETTKFDPPFSEYKQKGIYPSYIHLNIHGPPEYELLRRAIKFFDDNAFVTLWVSSILLEVTKFREGPLPSDEQLMNAIEAIATYHDKNRLENDSILVFWTQTYNSTTGIWSCGPVNLKGYAKEGRIMEVYIKKILEDLGLEKLWDKIEPILDTYLQITKTFVIPADFDDTFVNLGFGSLLKNYQIVSKQPYLTWLKNNTNISAAIAVLKKYAYKPFNKIQDSNSIDPRTYFYTRKFLLDFTANGTKELSLVPTWVQSSSESRAKYPVHYCMPFNINNVDLTVSANVIYGLTAALLSDMQDPTTWFDEEVQTLYNSTTALLSWQIAHNFSSRPDLALTYYPSLFNFYWFTSRILNLLDSFDNLPYPVLEVSRDRLSTALRNSATKDILNRATYIEDSVYFDDFLGDGDTDIFGKPVKHGDDRICSTSMAINALFYSWSQHGKLLPTLPTNVRNVLLKSCNWLSENVLSDRYQHMNAFFSGSVKNVPSDLPIFYPLNIIEHANGTLIPPDYNITSKDSDICCGVSGIIPPDQYNEMLKKEHFGYHTPINFHGYNTGQSVIEGFPFWSSDSFTYSASLLALTQCRAFDLNT